MRLDKHMYERGLAESRSRAQALIMSGKVFVDGNRASKAGLDINQESLIEIRGPVHPYVSRGGIKLEAALNCFDINCHEKVALDVGASTGGFTDCLLQHGIKRVYALDVGYGQLDWKLRQDNRVVSLEKINVRHMDPGLIPESLDIVTIDCSFISLKLVLSKIVTISSEGTQIIALIKPQFEVGKGEVEKGGVIRDQKKHERVLRGIFDFAHSKELSVKGLLPSPVKGPKGNKEFLIYMIYRHRLDIKFDMEEAIKKALTQTGQA